MSESKHTAGPWRIEGRRGPGYIISHGVCADGDGPEGYVGVLDPMFHVAGAPSALASNACLIAAAPDLLAAAIHARMCVPFPSDAHAKLDAAIQKATA